MILDPEYPAERHDSNSTTYGLDSIITIAIDGTDRIQLISRRTCTLIGELVASSATSVCALAYDGNATHEVGVYRRAQSAVQAVADSADGWAPNPCATCGCQHRWNRRVDGVWLCQFHAAPAGTSVDH